MKNGRFSDAQVMAIPKQAEGRMPMAELISLLDNLKL